MGRIRSIKPEFPQSESLGRCSRDARLLFVNLWTICDDEGRTRGASRMLASLLFPYDDDAPKLVDGWIAELERERCVARYTVEGSQYLQIVNWLIHQRIDRPSKSRIPPFDAASSTPREDSRAIAPDLGPRTLDLVATAKAVAGKTSRGDVCPVAQIVDLYHELMPANPKVAKITRTRRGHIQQRWREDLPTLDRWRNFFTYCAKSPFLTGKAPASGDRPPFIADIDWLCKPVNFTKIAEKKYHQQPGGNGHV